MSVVTAAGGPVLEGLGAAVVPAHLTDVEAVTPVPAGAEALDVIWPDVDPQEAAGATALPGAARAAGVPRVVHHSLLRPQARSTPHHAAKDRM